MALFYVFLGVVPGSAGVSHEHGQRETSCQSAYQKAQHTGHTQNDTHQNGDDDGQKRWQYHLVLRASGGYFHASAVVGSTRSVEYALDFAELPAHFFNHLSCCAAHGTHGQSAEQEGCHGSDECTHQHTGVHQVYLEEVHVVGHSGFQRVEDVSGRVYERSSFVHGTLHGNLDFLYVRGQQGQRGERGRAYGKAFTRSCGGVA